MTGTVLDANVQTYAVQLDFQSLFQRTCKPHSESPDDFEVWHPVDPKSNSVSCFLGQKGAFLRRKTDSICVIGPDFNSTAVTPEPCPCNDEDYECDTNFFRNEIGKCVLYGKDPDQPMSCATGTKYLGKSGYRKLALSKCSGGLDLTKKVERECGADPSSPTNVKGYSFVFDSVIDDFFYFKNSGTILVKDSEQKGYISKNEGTSWERIIPDGGAIMSILEDPSVPSRAYVVTSSMLWITSDTGVTFEGVAVPNPPNLNLAPVFLIPHPKHPDWLLWIGSVGCTGDFSDCHSQVSVSWDSGHQWRPINNYVRTCLWAATDAFQAPDEKTIYCSVFDAKEGDQRSMLRMSLARSNQQLGTWTTMMETDGFAIEGEYLIVTVPDANTKEVDLQVSMNGIDFQSALFPQSFVVHDGYTVLQSNTGNVFLHVIQSIIAGSEFGTLVKSNWNGLSYHKALDFVNQNRQGYVDFEKVEGINGTIVLNQISNTEELPRGKSKRLVTKMSYDDGETWSFLKAPTLDSGKKPYVCKGDCTRLHLHAFTERHDKRDSFSSPGAAGLMIGVGNVGEYLGDFNNGDMFLSRDAGRTWAEIAKEAHMVEISDHGAIILMVNDEGPVTEVKYSLDDGLSFLTYDLNPLLKGEKIRIQNIITEPSGTTSQFVLIGKLASADKSVAVHLDFSNVWGRICETNEDESKSDFELWTPNSVVVENAVNTTTCTFGSKVYFMRRKAMQQCYIGDSYQSLDVTHVACECTISDFECDSYHTFESGKCVPLQNAAVPEPACINGVKHSVTGYIKKKISQCDGGLDLAPVPSPCGGELCLD
ncbi:vacuolar protein sorting/targeting protein PEP1 [Kappamyces sp. JEL0680]|nr:vacuolar protein sorting/targeting protein PEP1 [Kappamyces sp. JEL0680]